jgi:hypothetical protein
MHTYMHTHTHTHTYTQPVPDAVIVQSLMGMCFRHTHIMHTYMHTHTHTHTYTQPVPDAVIVQSLMDMGFGENGSKRAALATNNSGSEAAMEWVFAHMEDPDFNDPLPPAGCVYTVVCLCVCVCMFMFRVIDVFLCVNNS